MRASLVETDVVIRREASLAQSCKLTPAASLIISAHCVVCVRERQGVRYGVKRTEAVVETF